MQYNPSFLLFSYVSPTDTHTYNWYILIYVVRKVGILLDFLSFSCSLDFEKVKIIRIILVFIQFLKIMVHLNNWSELLISLLFLIVWFHAKIFVNTASMMLLSILTKDAVNVARLYCQSLCNLAVKTSL